MSQVNEKLDLTRIRARLASSQGPRYWRSLEELAETSSFKEFLQREFPEQASEWNDSHGRRNFLKLMGASLALAGLTACTRQPEEKIMPYVRAPEEVIPGRPLFYATAMPLSGVGTGLLVESHMGRPTKVEGNPEHPASLGAADAISQASVLTLYDPDRSRTLKSIGEIRTWSSFLGEFRSAISAQKLKKGNGLRILTETITSPTIAAQIRAVQEAFPEAKWHQWEPAGEHSARAGAQLAFGEAVNTYYELDKADVILSLDADFLGSGPASLRCARQFSNRRRVTGNKADISRLYVVESTPTVTGGRADHRLPLRTSEMEGFAWALAAKLGVAGSAKRGAAYTANAKFIDVVARDLRQHGAASVVIAGAQQSPAVHALAHGINQALGNNGTTVVHTDPIEANPVDQVASLKDLLKDLDQGAVDLLLILGGNPVYNAPADLNFRERFMKAKARVHLSLYEDETSELSHWHVPAAHYLEMWSDIRAFDGTVSIIQPLIAPLYHGRSPHEVLQLLADRPERSAYDTLRDYWTGRRGAADFEKWWRKSVHDGVIAGSALPPKKVAIKAGWEKALPESGSHKGLEVVFKPDPTVYDGQFANNGWLQEAPKPITKLTWDNTAQIGPLTAQRLGLQSEDLVELRCRGRVVRAPVWIVPGHAPDSITVHLGYGRSRAGRVGSGVGFNAYSIRAAESLWRADSVELRKLNQKFRLANTQEHHSMEGRHLVRSGTLDEYAKHPNFAQEMEPQPPRELTLYKEEHKYDGYSWGMAIDLNACIGCNACVVACQAENNVPVVGKDQVSRGREMHWIRVDRYYEGNLDNPQTHHQPVMCVHCENAPCEVVCPVAATVHNNEGLNDMVYNRCVGTRYCSNNCPYKVRRFNFLLYADFETPSLQLGRNPDVTVRSRGVMEKCTYCVQRINQARIDAKREDRQIRDGEVVTACQATCPAQAIVFGNLNDPGSKVAQWKKEQRNYALLAEVNTRPRTSYLASLRNPNPELESV